MTRREYLTFFSSSATAVVLLLGGQAAATHEPLLDATRRDKLLLLLRKHGARGGLRADVSAILGLYNRGQNMLVVRMSVRSGQRIQTFGRVVMRHRELYYWGFQPDVTVLTTYFFLTDWQFRLVARGVELVNEKATALAPDRSEAIVADLVKGWTAIIDTA